MRLTHLLPLGLAAYASVQSLPSILAANNATPSTLTLLNPSNPSATPDPVASTQAPAFCWSFCRSRPVINCGHCTHDNIYSGYYTPKRKSFGCRANS